MAEINEMVADAAMEIAETATNVADVSRGISGINVRYLVGGAIIGSAIGFAVGYKIRRKAIENHYYEVAGSEIEEMRVVFENLKKKHEDELSQSRENEARMRVRLHEEMTGPKPELDGMMETLGYKVKDPATKDATYVDPEDVEVIRPAKKIPLSEVEIRSEDVRNVFDRPKMGEWDYAVEVKSRSPEMPYIIHEDEHEAGEKGYDQVSLTLYEDDDVLADEDDTIVEHNIVGMHNLTRFGHGSKNPNLLYVRNDELETDYEIAKSAGSYAQEVHGFKHADDDRRPRRDWDG